MGVSCLLLRVQPRGAELPKANNDGPLATATFVGTCHMGVTCGNAPVPENLFAYAGADVGD